MPRILSASALQALLAQNTGEAFLVRLRISHADLADELRLVQDMQPLVLTHSADDSTIREIVNDVDATHEGSPLNWTRGLRKSSAVIGFLNASNRVALLTGTRPNYPITVEVFWGLNGTAWGNVDYNLAYVGSPGATVGGWILLVNPSKVVEFKIYTGAEWKVASAPNLPLGGLPNQYRLSGTYDGSTVKVFVNGVQGSVTEVLNTQTLSTTTPFRFGSNPASSGSTMWTDDVRIWNTALSDTAIRQFSKIELLGNETNLVYYYPCNDGQYTPFPFDITLPSDDERGVPDVQLTIDNVDRRITQALRTLSTEAPDISIDVVVASTPTVVELGPIDFKLRDAVYTATTVTGTLAYKSDILGEQFPKDTFNPSNRSGMKYLS